MTDVYKFCQHMLVSGPDSDSAKPPMHSPGNSARSAAERQLTVSDKLARQVAMTAQQLTNAAHSTEGSAAFANHGSCVNGW